MTIKLLHNTPLHVCSTAIRKCWASEDKSDSYYKCSICGGTVTNADYCADCATTTLQKVCGEKDKELIHRVGNKHKHKSTLEHLVYTFDIDGISRACLQELARHRIASYSVKSTRYTLKELSNEKGLFNCEKYIVITGNDDVDNASCIALDNLKGLLDKGISSDIAKYCLPEAYKTSLVMTVNARSLQNFLELRTSKSALWEIRDLAKAMFEALPEEHKYLFTDSLYKEP